MSKTEKQNAHIDSRTCDCPDCLADAKYELIMRDRYKREKELEEFERERSYEHRYDVEEFDDNGDLIAD